MTNKHLGVQPDGTPVDLDLATLLRTRLLVTASSGAGKTGTLLAFCEQNASKVQILVIDPEGEFAVLRSAHPFVLVGPEGETPAMVRTAGLLAHRLLELGASAVMDIYELPMHQKHEFVRDFINALIAAPKNLWHPVIVIVDEAHIFAPEKGQGESVALEAMADLASRGRKRGYCAVLATQRLAKLQKSVAAECQNVLVGRTTQIDQSRAADVLNISGKASRDDFGRTIGRLPTGDFFAYGMAFNTEEPTRFTVRRADTMPKSGAKRMVVPPPPHEVQALLPKLSDLPVEAEVKAKTEADLKKEIADLKKHLKDASQNSITPERERMLVAQVNELQKTAGTYEKVMSLIYSHAATMQDAAGKIKESIDEIRQRPSTAPKMAFLETKLEPMEAPFGMKSGPIQAKNHIPSKSKVNSTSDLSGPEQRIVNSIAWFHALGIDEPEKAAVAFMAGYTIGSGGFNNPCGSLNRKGLINYLPDNRIRLTADGLANSLAIDVPATNEALHEAVLSKLGGPERRILEPLLKSYPSGMDNPALASASGYAPNSGGYNNPRGRLKSLGLIRYESGIVYANSLLFPEG